MERVVTILTTPFEPYVYTLIGIGIAVFFVIRGSLRGLMKELSSILSLGASIVLAKPLGNLTMGFLPLDTIPLIFHSLIALTIGGLLGYVLVRFGFFLLTKLCGLDREWKGRTRVIMRLGGAIIGGLFGIALVFIVSWYILLMGKISIPSPVDPEETVRRTGTGTGTGTVTGFTTQDLLQLPAKIVSSHRKGLAESSLGSIAEETNPAPEEIQDAIDIVSTITKNPEKMQQLMQSEEISNVMEQKAVQTIMQNTEIQTMAAEGDMMGLMNHPDVQAMLNDPDVQAALEDIDTETLLELLE